MEKQPAKQTAIIVKYESHSKQIYAQIAQIAQMAPVAILRLDPLINRFSKLI